MSTPPLRIVIADDEPLIRMDLHQILTRQGHQIIAEAADGSEAVKAAQEMKPDAVILDIKMPRMDGIEAAKAITSAGIAPVVLLTAYLQKDLIDQAIEAGVSAYLVKPFKEADLLPTIEIAIARFAQYHALESVALSVEEKLETRKAVERAKGILIDLYGLKEQEAFRRIQTQSMNSRRSMREIAEAVVIAHRV